MCWMSTHIVSVGLLLITGPSRRQQCDGGFRFTVIVQHGT